MLVMMMSGLCAGSVAFFSSSPAASIAFFTPFMSSLMVQVVRYDSGAQPILPSAVGVFILCALLFTRTSWHQFVENVQVLVERDEALSAASTNRGQLEATLAQMQDLAMVDQLTGLKNRRAFFDDAETAIAASRRRDQPVSVAVLDLDHFKAVNDTHGHAAGDVVLREAAQRIADSVREEVLVGRYGGEEFVMLLPFTTPAQALVALERIRKAVSQDPSSCRTAGPSCSSRSAPASPRSTKECRFPWPSTAPTRRCTGRRTSGGIVSRCMLGRGTEDGGRKRRLRKVAATGDWVPWELWSPVNAL